MRNRSRAHVLISMLVASGCSAGTGGGASTGAAQGSGASDTGSGAQASTGASSGQVAAAPSGSTGGSSGAASLSGASVGPPTSGSAAVSGSVSSSSGTAASSSGAVGGAGATSGAASAGATGASSEAGAATEGGVASTGPFTCNLVLGLFTTSQWFNGTNPGGASKTFLMDGVDATRWESKTQKYSYVEKWIDPASPLWNLTTNNPCKTNANTPDRILFVGFSPDSPQGKTQAGWEMLLNNVIATIKLKYPSAKEIDILTMGRAPNNVQCANNSDVRTVIQPYEDAAYQAVATASGGFIVVGPKYYVPDCTNSYIFPNDTDYTTTAANYIATQVAAYYVAHP